MGGVLSKRTGNTTDSGGRSNLWRIRWLILWRNAGLVAAALFAHADHRAARLLDVRLLFALRLFLAIDAQGGDRTGEQALEPDALAARFALVDGAAAQPFERA